METRETPAGDGEGEGKPASWADRNVWSRLERLTLSRPGRLLPWGARSFILTACSAHQWRRLLDERENSEGRLPDDEEFKVEAIWLSECYPPSYLDHLVAGLDALRVGGHHPGTDPPADLVRRYRSGAYAGGTVNLGFFTRPGGGVFGADYVQTDLPACVERARGWLEKVTPSLTVVTVQFELADDARDRLERSLRAAYRTRVTRRRGGWGMETPDNQRRQRFDDAIAELNRECAAWFGRRLPGVFAAGLLQSIYPACALVITKECTPLVSTDEHIKWMWTARVDDGIDAWDSVEWRGLRLRTPSRDPEVHQWWLMGRRGEFLSDPHENHLEFYGGANRHGWLNRINLQMSLLLMRHAVNLLVLGLHGRVSRSRDAMGADATRKWNIARVNALRLDVTAFVRDVEPVAAELAGRRWRTFDVAAFEPGPHHILRLSRDSHAFQPAEDPRERSFRTLLRRLLRRAAPLPQEREKRVAASPLPTLAKAETDDIRFRARSLLKAERQQRDALATVAMLVSATESFRLNRRLFGLTLALGIVAVIAALPQVATVVDAAMHQLGLR